MSTITPTPYQVEQVQKVMPTMARTNRKLEVLLATHADTEVVIDTMQMMIEELQATINAVTSVE